MYSHGFVNGTDGRKMSKSLGNVVDPVEVSSLYRAEWNGADCLPQILDKYPVDSVRYYMCSAATYGADLNCSVEAMVTMHNAELADILGNLVHRVLNLAQKYCGGAIPDTKHDDKFPLPFDLAVLKEGVAKDMEQSAINLALFKAMDCARATNR